MRRWLLLLIVFLTFTIVSGAPMDPDSAWRDFVSREGNQWRPHFTEQHTVASLYGFGAIRHATPVDAADNFIRENAAMLGIDRVADLQLESAEADAGRSHAIYRQILAGLPVVGATVEVHTGRDNRIIAANSSFHAGLRLSGQITNTVEAARATASRLLGGHASVSQGQLMILPMGQKGVPVWRIEIQASSLDRGSWLTYVDAARPWITLRAFKTYASFDGKGNVFLQNPVVTPSQTAQTFKNMDGSKSLKGKFVKVFNANSQHDVPFVIDLSDYTTASDPNRNYNYPVGDVRLAEAMEYFHVNKVHDQWQSFGFQALNVAVPIFVNVLDSGTNTGLDNAFYSRSFQFPKAGILVIGAGTVFENLGLDCDVVYHEYGHNVLDHVKPGFFEAQESVYPGAFHEGFGDMSDAAITGNSKIGEFALRRKVSKQFVGRNIENNNRFPQNVILPSIHKSEVHFTGLIAGGSWWDLQQAIGSHQAQLILFKCLKLMPNEMNFFDFRDAMITADVNLNGGAEQQAITNAFTNHGLGGTDPGQPGTVNVSALKTCLLNLNTGKLLLKTTFHKGDTIIVVGNYTASGLTPGYNLIPSDVDYTPPMGSNASLFLLLDEVVNGSHIGVNGVEQAIFFTDANTKAATYKISIASDLANSDKTTTKRTATFKIQP